MIILVKKERISGYIFTLGTDILFNLIMLCRGQYATSFCRGSIRYVGRVHSYDVLVFLRTRVVRSVWDMGRGRGSVEQCA